MKAKWLLALAGLLVTAMPSVASGSALSVAHVAASSSASDAVSVPETAGAWSAEVSGTTADLRGVSFVDPEHGWAVGAGGTILATVDGGASWRAQTSGTTSGLTAVPFVDAERGWAVGGGGTIRATVDGGTHWSDQGSGLGLPGVALNGVSFVDADHGRGVGYSSHREGS